eukprot:snap_masked-scaffold_14-processed-gene-11.8-mRNA-1 protein AED:1.00 eAED:1.00 QI:0/0/0/0/1/1/2/0/144
MLMLHLLLSSESQEVTTCPLPELPTSNILAPICESKLVLAFSLKESSPPSINVNVELIAPFTPPETGASIKGRVFERERTSRGETVLQSTHKSTEDLSTFEYRSATIASLGSMVITRFAPSRASSTLLHGWIRSETCADFPTTS